MLPRLLAIVRDSSARVVLTTEAFLQMAEHVLPMAPELASLRWVATDALPEGSERAWRRPSCGSETIAFLQYTSWSTGEPKGVVVKHGNLLYNQQMIQRAFEHDAGLSLVGWLPLYHDMGLIGNMMQPLCVGGVCTLMSPTDFIARPMRWLEAVSRF